MNRRAGYKQTLAKKYGKKLLKVNSTLKVT